MSVKKYAAADTVYPWLSLSLFYCGLQYCQVVGVLTLQYTE